MKQKVTKKEINTLLDAGNYRAIIDRLIAVSESEPSVRSPNSAAEMFRKWAAKDQEHFLVATLDGAHKKINVHVITIGIANKTMVHPREVFRPAIKDGACAIIVAHNHPSGACEPSEEDINVTKRLKEAGELIGITVLDALIITPRRAYSIETRADLSY